MNKVITLDKDNLHEFMFLKDLIVVYTQASCGACTKILPHLYELDDKYTIIISDVREFPRGSLLKTDGINFVPTFGLFEEGSYIREVSSLEIKNKLQ